MLRDARGVADEPDDGLLAAVDGIGVYGVFRFEPLAEGIDGIARSAAFEDEYHGCRNLWFGSLPAVRRAPHESHEDHAAGDVAERDEQEVAQGVGKRHLRHGDAELAGLAGELAVRERH